MQAMTSAAASDALVLVDKPAGVTSFDVVRRVGRALGTRRVGHGGTLDPFATGLLVILSGRATRLIRFVPGEPKIYDAVIEFGVATDTDDATGAPIRTAELPDPVRVREAIAALSGTIQQMPPAYSAKKIGGQRAYAVARRGESPALSAVAVTVHAWDIIEHAPHRLRAKISCGAGTYIRALARDLGDLTGSAAHLAQLRRLRSGPFHVEDADSLEVIEQGNFRRRSAIDALVGWERQALAPEQVLRVRQGRAVDAESRALQIALVDEAGALVAVAARRGDSWHPSVVFPHDE